MIDTAPETLVLTGPETPAALVRDSRSGIVRKSEWVILGFLIYAVALGGSAELTITERPLRTAGFKTAQQLITQGAVE